MLTKLMDNSCAGLSWLTPILVFLAISLARSSPFPEVNINVDAGGSIRIPCDSSLLLPGGTVDHEAVSGVDGNGGGDEVDVTWILPDRSTGATVQEESGALVIKSVSPSMDGVYTCTRNLVSIRIHLHVFTIPERVVNLTVLPQAEYATVVWSIPEEEVAHNPIEGFLCQYRRDTSRMAKVSADDLLFLNATVQPLGSASRTCDLYSLQPRTSYFVKVAAYNHLGTGDFVSVVFKTLPVSAAPCGPLTASSATPCRVSDEGSDTTSWVTLFLISLTLVTSLVILIVVVTSRARKRTPSATWIKSMVSYPPVDGDDEEESTLHLIPNIITNPVFSPAHHGGQEESQD